MWQRIWSSCGEILCPVLFVHWNVKKPLETKIKTTTVVWNKCKWRWMTGACDEWAGRVSWLTALCRLCEIRRHAHSAHRHTVDQYNTTIINNRSIDQQSSSRLDIASHDVQRLHRQLWWWRHPNSITATISCCTTSQQQIHVYSKSECWSLGFIEQWASTNEHIVYIEQLCSFTSAGAPTNDKLITTRAFSRLNY